MWLCINGETFVKASLYWEPCSIHKKLIFSFGYIWILSKYFSNSRMFSLYLVYFYMFQASTIPMWGPKNCKERKLKSPEKESYPVNRLTRKYSTIHFNIERNIFSAFPTATTEIQFLSREVGVFVQLTSGFVWYIYHFNSLAMSCFLYSTLMIFLYYLLLSNQRAYSLC